MKSCSGVDQNSKCIESTRNEFVDLFGQTRSLSDEGSSLPRVQQNRWDGIGDAKAQGFTIMFSPHQVPEPQLATWDKFGVIRVNGGRREVN